MPPKASRAEARITAGGSVSVQVRQEFIAVARAIAGLSLDEAVEGLDILKAACAVVAVDGGAHELALDITRRVRVSNCDTATLAAALKAGCDALWREDMHDGREIDRLTICNPFTD